MDIVGEDESHPLSSLMETLGTLIEAYEIQNIEDQNSDFYLLCGERYFLIYGR